MAKFPPAYFNGTSDSDRLEQPADHLTNYAMIAADGSLMGPDGAISVGGLGDNVLTVGAGGKYATLQAALDYVATQPAFVLLSADYTVLQNGAVTTWAQDSSTFATSTTVYMPASGQFITPVPVEKVWFKVAGDSYYYPLEEASGVVTGQSLGTGMRRIEASVSTPKALSWYRQNDFTIMLLDAYTSQTVSMTADMCITITGTGGNTFIGGLGRSAGCTSGKVTFKNLILSAQGVGGFISWDSINKCTVALEFLDGCQINSVHDDFIFPGGQFGSLRVDSCSIAQQPTAPQGHVFSGLYRGDVIIQDNVWRPICHSSIGSVPFGNVYLADIASARTVIMSSNIGYLRDKFSDWADVSFFGSAVITHTADMHFVNNALIAPDAIGGNISIVKLDSFSTGATLSLSGNSLVIKSTSGVVRLVRAAANPAGACTVKVGRGNNVTKCDTQANITYTREASQVTGTATISAATSVAVTHGLGYTPNVADIQCVPTSLTTAKGWWITAVGATTFTINLDVSGSATFAWRIAE